MRFYPLNLFLLIGLLLLSSCRKDIDKTTSQEIEPEIPVYVNSSITGVVYDQKGQPLINVQIDLDNYQVFTDDNGFFYLKDIQANVKGALIRASLSGYTPTTTWVYPQLKSISFITITLLKEKFRGEVNGLSGGIVTFGTNSSVQIPANALLTQNGQPFSGTAKVYAKWFNPLNRDFSNNELSFQLGFDQAKSYRVLQSFGAAYIQIKDENNENLQITPYKSIIVSLEIPDEYNNQSPFLLKSWTLLSPSAIWKVSSSALKKDNQYQSKVTQLGWVNIANDYDYTSLTVDLSLDDGTPISFTKFDIESKGLPFQLRLRSDVKGRIQAYIPKGEAYNISLRDCMHANIITKTTAVITEKSNPIEMILDDRSQLTDINAQLISCDMASVKKGYLLLKADPNLYLPVDKNGTIHFTQLICLDEMNIEYQAIDWSNEKMSKIHSQKLNTFLNLGDVIACPTDPDSSYVIIKNEADRFEGISATAQFVAYNSDTIVRIRADFGLDDSEFQFKLSLNRNYIKGSQEAVEFLYFEKEKDIELTLNNDQIVNDQVNVNILTKAEIIGDYLEGSFNLEYVKNGNNKFMEGAFKAKLIH